MRALNNNTIPFNIHNKRRNNAINGFLEHSFTNTMIKYLYPLKEDKLTVKRFSEILDIRKDSLLDTVRKSQYSPFLKINGEGIRGKPFILSITNEGNEFMNMINKIQEIK